MKTVARLGGLGSVAFLVWAAIAVLDGDRLLVAVLPALWLLTTSGSALAGLAGLAVALYVGQWWPAAALVFLLGTGGLPRLLPLWSLRRRTDPTLLLAAINSVDPDTGGILARAAAY